MSHAWWRDSDYELFGRLTKEVAVLRADLDVAESRKSQVIHDLVARAEKAEAERDALRALVADMTAIDEALRAEVVSLRAQVEAARKAIAFGMSMGDSNDLHVVLAAMDGAKP